MMKFDDAASETPAGDKLQKAVTLVHNQGWRQNADEKINPPISLNERTSLSALIAYVAMHSGENEFRVERRLSDRFNVPNMTCLPAAHYNDAVRYLVDGLPGL